MADFVMNFPKFCCELPSIKLKLSPILRTEFIFFIRGSYSPRFLGRKYVNPNMSRYRIGGPQSGMMKGEDDGVGDDEFSDDEIVTTGKELREDDLDSEDSYEIGIEQKLFKENGYTFLEITCQLMSKEENAL